MKLSIASSATAHAERWPRDRRAGRHLRRSGRFLTSTASSLDRRPARRSHPRGRGTAMPRRGGGRFSSTSPCPATSSRASPMSRTPISIRSTTSEGSRGHRQARAERIGPPADRLEGPALRAAAAAIEAARRSRPSGAGRDPPESNTPSRLGPTLRRVTTPRTPNDHRKTPARSPSRPSDSKRGDCPRKALPCENSFASPNDADPIASRGSAWPGQVRSSRPSGGGPARGDGALVPIWVTTKETNFEGHYRNWPRRERVFKANGGLLGRGRDRRSLKDLPLDQQKGLFVAACPERRTRGRFVLSARGPGRGMDPPGSRPTACGARRPAPAAFLLLYYRRTSSSRFAATSRRASPARAAPKPTRRSCAGRGGSRQTGPGRPSRPWGYVPSTRGLSLPRRAGSWPSRRRDAATNSSPACAHEDCHAPGGRAGAIGRPGRGYHSPSGARGGPGAELSSRRGDSGAASASRPWQPVPRGGRQRLARRLKGMSLSELARPASATWLSRRLGTGRHRPRDLRAAHLVATGDDRLRRIGPAPLMSLPAHAERIVSARGGGRKKAS